MCSKHASDYLSSVRTVVHHSAIVPSTALARFQPHHWAALRGQSVDADAKAGIAGLGLGGCDSGLLFFLRVHLVYPVYPCRSYVSSVEGLSVDATQELVRGIARPRQLRQFLVDEIGAKVQHTDKLGQRLLFGATGREPC